MSKNKNYKEGVMDILQIGFIAAYSLLFYLSWRQAKRVMVEAAIPQKDAKMIEKYFAGMYLASFLLNMKTHWPTLGILTFILAVVASFSPHSWKNGDWKTILASSATLLSGWFLWTNFP